MLTTRHTVDFAYARPELEALFRHARSHDSEQGGRYDAGSAAITVWLHHWGKAATREASEIIGTFDVPWDPPALSAIETEEGFSREDLLQALGRLECKALGRVTPGDVPHERQGP